MEAESRIERPPILFAHRGGKADAPENTIEAFSLALSNHATGLESDARLTKCGNVVLHHDRHYGRLFWRRQVKNNVLDALPSTIPTLEKFFSTIKGNFDLSLDVKDSESTDNILAIAERFSFPLKRLWLCHPDIEKITAWRACNADVRLINSTAIDRIKEGPERRLATLKEIGVDAFNLHFSEWNEGLVSLCHRFEVRSFAWDAQEERQIKYLLKIGVDGIFSDHVKKMSEMWSEYRDKSSRVS